MRAASRVAVLWATEDTIYGQFGYGMARWRPRSTCRASMRRLTRQVETPGQARLVPLAEAEPLVAPIYERVARETPGMFARTSAVVAGPAADRSAVAARQRRRAALRGVRDRRHAVGLRVLSRQRGIRARQLDRPYFGGRGDGRFRRRRRTRSGASCSASTGGAGEGDLLSASIIRCCSRWPSRAG